MGHIADTIITREGKVIGSFDIVFKGVHHIKLAQIIQESLDFIRVKVVPVGYFGAQDIQDIGT
jgi:hypothetical protein